MSQIVAKIINFNFNERFDFAMILHNKEMIENGEEYVKWEKIRYSPQKKALPRVQKFEEPNTIEIARASLIKEQEAIENRAKRRESYNSKRLQTNLQVDVTAFKNCER